MRKERPLPAPPHRTHQISRFTPPSRTKISHNFDGRHRRSRRQGRWEREEEARTSPFHDAAHKWFAVGDHVSLDTLSVKDWVTITSCPPAAEPDPNPPNA